MLTGLLIFLLVVIALLAIPLTIEFRFEWPDDKHNELVLVWALGLVRARMQTKGSEPTSTVKAVSPDSKERPAQISECAGSRAAPAVPATSLPLRRRFVALDN